MRLAAEPLTVVIGEVACRLLGPPNRRLSTRQQLRFGSRGALAVQIGDTRRGCWFDHAAGVGGGVIDLVVRELGGSRSDAANWLRDQRFFNDTLASPPSGIREADTGAAHINAVLAPWGHRLWASCKAITATDPAGRYLRARGCALPPQDSHSRWHPRLRHACGHEGPALVSLVTAVCDADRWLTLHRIWISADGSGRKAFDHLPKDERPQARLVLAGHTTARGCIRLWPDSDVDTRLTVGEGIESCLAAAQTHRPAWSCLSAGNLKSLPLLAGVESLTIACDHDAAGIAAALDVGGRWHAAGRQVAVLYPAGPQSDWADVVAASRSAA